jgi:hypothetical protein
VINELRKVGGTWESKLVGFGSREYYGNVEGRNIKLKAFAHSTMPIAGDDPHQTFWHIFLDGQDVDHTYRECIVSKLKEILDTK